MVCIASGPSLTVADCEMVRESGHPVVVTNTTFRLCPWADVLFGFDFRWWKVHHVEVNEVFRGRKISSAQHVGRYGVESAWANSWFPVYRNSGCCAVSIAMSAGASRVVLLGYDGGFFDNRKHWHGDHPKGLDNASTVAQWGYLFGVLARRARQAGVTVVNASRRTHLTCFPTIGLEEALRVDEN